MKDIYDDRELAFEFFNGDVDLPYTHALNAYARFIQGSKDVSEKLRAGVNLRILRDPIKRFQQDIYLYSMDLDEQLSGINPKLEKLTYYLPSYNLEHINELSEVIDIILDEPESLDLQEEIIFKYDENFSTIEKPNLPLLFDF